MGKLAFILLSMSLAAHAANTFGVGQRDYVFRDKVRNRKLSTYVWYPIENKIKQIPIGKGPFLPVIAAKNAEMLKTSQKYPVVLLSHGSGGKADKLFWLTNYLVKNGVVVVGVDHPGNMTGDSSADGMMRIWDRAKDLSFTFDQVLETPEFKSQLDTEKVAAAGHSAGGATVLLLAGGQFSLGQLGSPIPSCEGSKDPYFAKHCNEMKTLDVKKYPKAVVEGDYRDPRVKSVVSFDPGAVRWFKTDSLKDLKATPHLFLAEKLNAPQDEILSKEFTRLLPSENVEVVPNSYHMTFLNACKPGIPLDDPELKELCIGNDKKIQIQIEVARKSLEFIQKSWL